MEEIEVDRWFDSYVADFAALGRGDTDDTRRILAHYGVPLLSTDAGCMTLTTRRRSTQPHNSRSTACGRPATTRSDELAAETTVLNRFSATHRARFSCLRADGSEIEQLEATYLITDGTAGRRISAIVVHSAP